MRQDFGAENKLDGRVATPRRLHVFQARSVRFNVTRAFTCALLGVFVYRAVFGQAPANTPAAGLRFEVASVKRALNWPPPAGGAPGERGAATGGGGCPTSMKVEPRRVEFRCATLAMLIGYAYRISPDRVNGPEWMKIPGSPRFNIVATIPEGGSKNQVPEMFQALLAERFKLATHRRTDTLPAYALVVAKGGLKTRLAAARGRTEGQSAEAEAAASLDGYYGSVESRAIPNGDGNDSMTLLANARMGTVRQTGDPSATLRWDAPDISFAGLADLLDHVAPTALPVIDMTGVSGRYQLVLEVSFSDLRAAGRATADMENTVLSAFNDGLRKLGLRLERRRGPVETIVVDRIERTPTEN